MSTDHFKALVLSVVILGYVALIQVVSYVVKRRFAAALQRRDGCG
jgi:hypothetical protein